MQAVIEALKTTDASSELVIYTDSQYVKNGVTTWIHSWKRNRWKTASKKPVKNKDLWIEMDGLREDRRVDWRWVKGHAGDEGNERADALARQGALEAT